MSQTFHRRWEVVLAGICGALLLGAVGLAPGDLRADPERKFRIPWPHDPGAKSVLSRFRPPEGFRRVPAAERDFGYWLRHLPVKPAGSQVRLFNGKPKKDQTRHEAVLDIDVGDRDLQLGADAVMRLRAEYLLAISREDLICFLTAGGLRASWSKWQDGYRFSMAHPSGWEESAKPSGDYSNFRKYLDKVFGLANSGSLRKQMVRVKQGTAPAPGDVYISGLGKRKHGHAVLVLDLAVNSQGKLRMLLVQSQTPAQELHILKNPSRPGSPWFEPEPDGSLSTPEWQFKAGSLFRFKEGGC